MRRAAAAAAVIALLAPAPAGAQSVEVRRDVQYGAAAGHPLLLDAYLPPAGGAARPAIVLIHGGGWRTGDKASWEDEARRFADHGWVAFSINYRLDEPAVFPAEIEDAQAAVRWVRAHAGEYGVDPRRIGALGESAGGHLATMLATLGEGSLEEGARIRVGAAWSPPADLAALARSRGDSWAAPLFGCTVATCPDRLADASPTTHVDRTDAPLYLMSSSDEQVPVSQSQALADRLEGAGVENRLDVLPGTRHALDYRVDAWAPTLAFLDSHLAAAPDAGSGGGRPAVLALVAVAAVGVGAGTIVVRRRRRRRAS